MRPTGRGLSLYYAHLDSQLARSGQSVRAGDTIGLMGNTGNARTTPPHLHFGIYSSGGAINPLPFVRPAPKLDKPEFNTGLLGRVVRTSGRQTPVAIDDSVTRQLASGSYLEVQSVSDGHFRVALPDGSTALLKRNAVTETTSMRSVPLSQSVHLLYAPFPGSAIVQQLRADTRVQVLAYHGDFMYVNYNNTSGWLPRGTN